MNDNLSNVIKSTKAFIQDHSVVIGGILTSVGFISALKGNSAANEEYKGAYHDFIDGWREAKDKRQKAKAAVKYVADSLKTTAKHHGASIALFASGMTLVGYGHASVLNSGMKSGEKLSILEEIFTHSQVSQARERIDEDTLSALESSGNRYILYEPHGGRMIPATLSEFRSAVSGLNLLLIEEEYVTLNDLYIQLGMSQTSLGELVGWNYSNPISASYYMSSNPNPREEFGNGDIVYITVHTEPRLLTLLESSIDSRTIPPLEALS